MSNEQNSEENPSSQIRNNNEQNNTMSSSDEKSTIGEFTQGVLEGFQLPESPIVNTTVNNYLAELATKKKKPLPANETIEKLIAKLTDQFWGVRLEAVQKLAKSGDERAVEPLIQALKNSFEGVRFNAALALGEIGDVRATVPLIATLNDPDMNVSSKAFLALEQIGKPAVPALIEALQNPDPAIRWIVATILGSIRDEQALPALIQIQQNDTAVDQYNRAVKDAAARAIRSIKPKPPKPHRKIIPLSVSHFTPNEAKFDWESLLREWSLALLTSNDLREEPPTEAIESEWLGYLPATEEQILTLEARLDIQLPPSYRAFLKVSNGWRQINQFIYKLWSTEEINWFKVRNQDWIDAWSTDHEPIDEKYLIYGEEQNVLVVPPQYLATALEISDVGDSCIFLLNPQIVTPEGEWEAWFFANWLPGATRYRSFWEMMQDEYRNFLRLEENK